MMQSSLRLSLDGWPASSAAPAAGEAGNVAGHGSPVARGGASGAGSGGGRGDSGSESSAGNWASGREGTSGEGCGGSELRYKAAYVGSRGSEGGSRYRYGDSASSGASGTVASSSSSILYRVKTFTDSLYSCIPSHQASGFRTEMVWK